MMPYDFGNVVCSEPQAGCLVVAQGGSLPVGVLVIYDHDDLPPRNIEMEDVAADATCAE